jgi:hypothetical protein
MLRYAQHDKEVNKLLYLVQGSSTLKIERKDRKKTEKNRRKSVNNNSYRRHRLSSFLLSVAAVPCQRPCH